jgi:hypothetical protein
LGSAPPPSTPTPPLPPPSPLSPSPPSFAFPPLGPALLPLPARSQCGHLPPPAPSVRQGTGPPAVPLSVAGAWGVPLLLSPCPLGAGGDLPLLPSGAGSGAASLPPWPTWGLGGRARHSGTASLPPWPTRGLGGRARHTLPIRGGGWLLLSFLGLPWSRSTYLSLRTPGPFP